MSLSLQSTIMHEEVPFDQAKEVVCMATIKALSEEQIATLKSKPEGETRAPVDIIAVLDRSGSMDSEGKLELVKVAMQFVCDQMRENDRLAIVTYDDKVDTVSDLVFMNSKNKSHLVQAIGQLVTGGSTNLSGGLFEGLSIAARADRSASNRAEGTPKNRVCSVFLFTDGMANVGLRSLAEIRPVMESMMIKSEGATVMTFGFGSDHDAILLKGLAESGRGLYYFVTKAEDIPIAFADCMGGLLSVVAQNIVITVEALGQQTELLQALTKYKTDIVEVNRKMRITLQDVYAGETKNILLRVNLPKRPESVENDLVLKVSASYVDVVSPGARDISLILTVNRRRELDAVNIVIDEQRNRFVAAEALETANQFGAQGRLKEARDHLANAKKHVQFSAANATPVSLELQRQLDTVSSRLDTSDNYNRFASKAMCQMATEHMYERSAVANMTESDESYVPTSAQYVTKSKMMYRGSAQAMQTPTSSNMSRPTPVSRPMQQQVQMQQQAPQMQQANVAPQQKSSGFFSWFSSKSSSSSATPEVITSVADEHIQPGDEQNNES